MDVEKLYRELKDDFVDAVDILLRDYYNDYERFLADLEIAYKLAIILDVFRKIIRE